jgi:hypothetical protein
MFARRDTQNDVLPGVDAVKRNAIENDGDRECCAKEAMVSYHDDLRRLLRVRDSRQSADTAVTGASCQRQRAQEPQHQPARGSDHALHSATHAALCTARHGVGSHALPPTMECAMPTGKKFARQSRAA